MSEKTFNGVSKKEAINFVDQSTEEDLIYYLSNTAYINVKKSNGVNVSEKSDLKAYAKKGIDILKEQIRFCNPSIILGGNVCDGIIDNLFDWGETLYNGKGHHALKIYEILIDGKSYPFINMYHPSYFGKYKENGEIKDMSEYFLELFKGIISVENERPGYWSKYMNNKCFETSNL